MREIFQKELQELGDDILQMGQLVAEAVERAGRALREADLQLAEEVIDADALIDAREERIEALCLSVLALQQPVATDLRVVITAMRLSATFERMGDLARHVAFIARTAYPNHAAAGPLFQTLQAMTLEATAITGMLLKLLDRHDMDLVAGIEQRDDALDDLLRQLFQQLLVEDAPAGRQELVDAVLASRFLERLGDHSVSAALRIGYLVTGELDKSVLLREKAEGEFDHI